MATASRLLTTFVNGRNLFVQSESMEIKFTSIEVGDGADLVISEGTVDDLGKFHFNDKDIVGVSSINGLDLAALSDALILGGDNELDGDKIAIDFVPVSYTPSTDPAEVDDVKHLSAHLKGIDSKLASLASPSGLDVKQSVVVALLGTDNTLDSDAGVTASSLTYSTTGGNGSSGTITGQISDPSDLLVDGATLAVGSRLLLASEQDTGGLGGAANGIWQVHSVAAPNFELRRPDDFASDEAVTANAFTFVEKGSCADCGLVLSTDDPITLESTALAWTVFSSPGEITAGNGLVKTGLNIAVEPDITNTDETLASVVVANSTGVSIKVDNATLATDQGATAGAAVLLVKDAGISNDKIAANTIGANKIANEFYGKGLTRNVSGSLIKDPTIALPNGGTPLGTNLVVGYDGANISLAGSGDLNLHSKLLGIIESTYDVGGPVQRVTVEHGSIVDGFSSLTPGARYYLGDLGAITTTVPTAGEVVMVGQATSASQLRFAPEYWGSYA